MSAGNFCSGRGILFLICFSLVSVLLPFSSVRQMQPSGPCQDLIDSRPAHSLRAHDLQNRVVEIEHREQIPGGGGVSTDYKFNFFGLKNGQTRRLFFAPSGSASGGKFSGHRRKEKKQGT